MSVQESGVCVRRKAVQHAPPRRSSSLSARSFFVLVGTPYPVGRSSAVATPGLMHLADRDPRRTGHVEATRGDQHKPARWVRSGLSFQCPSRATEKPLSFVRPQGPYTWEHAHLPGNHNPNLLSPSLSPMWVLAATVSPSNPNISHICYTGILYMLPMARLGWVDDTPNKFTRLAGLVNLQVPRDLLFGELGNSASNPWLYHGPLRHALAQVRVTIRLWQGFTDTLWPGHDCDGHSGWTDDNGATYLGTLASPSADKASHWWSAALTLALTLTLTAAAIVFLLGSIYLEPQILITCFYRYFADLICYYDTRDIHHTQSLVVTTLRSIPVIQANGKPRRFNKVPCADTSFVVVVVVVVVVVMVLQLCQVVLRGISCRAAVRRAMDRPPPTFLQIPQALPCDCSVDTDGASGVVLFGQQNRNAQDKSGSWFAPWFRSSFRNTFVGLSGLPPPGPFGLVSEPELARSDTLWPTYALPTLPTLLLGTGYSADRESETDYCTHRSTRVYGSKYQVDRQRLRSQLDFSWLAPEESTNDFGFSDQSLHRFMAWACIRTRSSPGIGNSLAMALLKVLDYRYRYLADYNAPTWNVSTPYERLDDSVSSESSPSTG
ncbi:hypothetical protein B0H66DRAFT_529758 [Apodospora peruviana]|uniref:Uncharacterized protein n=1 Tax=Apodospora peruviana TaxID=516989 RepID=A0AAE0IJ64_9PEZI|nr:hypothetical protein B0H66DRAFT_529758 [Apodospora peruviana]